MLLQLGVHDVHVDVADTERACRRAPTPGCLEVAHHPDADHSLVRADMAEHPALRWVWALWQPRDVLADGVLAKSSASPGTRSAELKDHVDQPTR